MGKSFLNYKSKLIICVLLSVMLFPGADLDASTREVELFNKGYEYYLSYQPEKAVEEFRAFLKEFPGSSVKDAVMFWLGKSSIQLKNFEEAKKSFSNVSQEFPESPYVKYVKRELEILNGAVSQDKFDLPPVAAETPEPERKGEIPNKVPAEIAAEAKPEENIDRQKANAEPVFINSEKQQSPAVNDLPEVPAENVQPLKASEEPVSLYSEKPQSAAVNNLPEVPAENVKLLPAVDEKKTEPIKPVGKGRDETEDYATYSSSVLTTLDIKDVLWRRGNISEDIENEKILFEGAKKANIAIDEVKYEELVLKYGFNAQQAGYLRKYLTICEFLDKKLKDMPEERIVESLVAKYGEGDKYRKVVISPEVQKEARNGMPFEDIQKLYLDLLKLVKTGYDEVEEDIREKIRYLYNDEVGVIWSEEGYTVLKPVLKKLSYKPFEETSPGVRKKIEGYIAQWLGELKRPGK